MPTIVAESLVVAETMPSFLPGVRGSAREVAARLARAALPPESPVPSPPWLLPGQRVSHARTLAALERFGGALLAEPVGTGKTYIALAAAHSLAGRATCIVPASLVSQWRRAAADLRVPLVVSSHERASRGTLPRADGLVIVDESHHYRSREARRYGHLARWIAGRRALLLTATPVINRLGDLIAQLLLVLPDDALAPLGVPSLAELPRRHAFPSALSLVVLTAAARDARPRADSQIVRPETTAGEAVADIRELVLSRNPAVARLVRSVLLRAAASSPAALDACLRRYRLLLLQGRDAVEAGVRPGRAELRRWAGELPEQTVLWQLFDDTPADAELELDDLASLDALVRRAGLAAERQDAKARRLVGLVADGARTLVFTSSRDTALWLRRWIEPAPAWCTGEAAGIGHTRMPRHSVLAGFAPAARAGARALPHVLISTEVAAEGLDLQGARRIVHYDLPWNPARLEQREGRARRLGSAHDVVQVITFEPPSAIERELRQLDILEKKRGLGARALVAGDTLQQWRGTLEMAAGSADPVRGVAAVSDSAFAGALVGLTLIELADEHAPWGTALCWLPAGRRAAGPVDDATILTARLAAAARSAGPAAPPDASELRWLDAAVAPPAAAMLRAANAASLRSPIPVPMRRLVRRLAAIGRAAARERDGARLEAVDRALRVVARGHSAGEALLIGELAGTAADATLVATLASLPDPPPRTFDVRVEGVVLFRAGGARLP
ncbi:MAG: helicase-related protein [Gemmatimonadota bacterium]